MTTRKYEFTGEEKVEHGATLRRIRRLSNGEVGGWVEKEGNLSHVGGCWVSGDAVVSDNAEVSGCAWVSGNAWVAQ